MPGFKYQAYSVEGKLHKGVLEADSARQARATLRDQGLTPYRVEVIAANDPAGGTRLRPVALSATELTQLTRGLASLLEAGPAPPPGVHPPLQPARKEGQRPGAGAAAGGGVARQTNPQGARAFPPA